MIMIFNEVKVFKFFGGVIYFYIGYNNIIYVFKIVFKWIFDYY